MHGPATVGWLLTAVCVLTAAACLLRAAAARAAERRAACSEAAMGAGMAVMALPAAPHGPAFTVALTVLFATLAAGEGVLLGLRLRAGPPRHAAHHLHHCVGALAMVHLCLAMSAGHAYGGAHGGSPGVPLLTAGLLAYFSAQLLRDGARLLPAAVPAGTVPAGGPLPRLRHPAGFAPACRLAMGAAMITMLLPW